MTSATDYEPVNGSYPPDQEPWPEDHQFCSMTGCSRRAVIWGYWNHSLSSLGRIFAWCFSCQTQSYAGVGGTTVSDHLDVMGRRR